MTRGLAFAVLFSTVGFALAACSGGGGGRSEAYSPGYGYPYSYGATQSSTCGATGTCPDTGLPRIVPGDEHGD